MESPDILVSIVIPIYNTEQYLNECLVSATKQSHKKLEIILVDDGSTDSSGLMCDKWEVKDRRIKVIHKKNEGLNYARKSGWEVATGDYITFLDSDDAFHLDNIKNCLEVIQKESVDMVAYMFKEFSDISGPPSPELINDYERKETPAEVFRFLLKNNNSSIYPMTAWGKLYRKKLIDAVDWAQSNMKAYEDNFFTPQIFDNTESFAVLKQPLYFYRRNDTGEVLSKTLVGNSRNGTPIGYLEYLDLMEDYWREFLDKHQVNIIEELESFCDTSRLFRLKTLIDASMLDSENNSQYVVKIIERLQARLSQNLSIKKEKDQEILDLTNQIRDLHIKIDELHTIKGAAHNLASSIKSPLFPKDP